jgi:hypothetical protein
MIGGRKGYNQDMTVVGIFLIMMLSLYLCTDGASGPTDAFRETYGPRSADDLLGPDDPGNGEPVIEEEVLLDEAGYTSEGTTTEADFEVPWNKTIEITVTLDWSDDYGDNDEFELVLYLEGGRVDRVSGTSGHLEIRQGGPSSGNYTVAVSALDCPGRVTPSPIDLDEGNDWALEVGVSYEVMG